MANRDLFRQLFRGYSKRDDSTFSAAAEEIIQDDTTFLSKTTALQ